MATEAVSLRAEAAPARSGSRTFVDATLPAGAASVIYQVRPIRGRQRGSMSEPVLLRFGTARAPRAAEGVAAARAA